MERYNIFYMVHKGLRALLYNTIMKLQQTDFTNEEETEAITAQVQVILDLFDKHAHSEDHFILSAIDAYEPSVVAIFAQEHVKDEQLTRGLADMLKAVSLAASPDAKKQMGRALQKAVTDFTDFNLVHMAKEEDVLNKILWRYYTDEELEQITQQIIAQIEPDKMKLYSKWMMHGLTNAEIINWLKQIKNTAPSFVFESMMQLAADELPEQRLQKIQAEICEGAMLV